MAAAPLRKCQQCHAPVEFAPGKDALLCAHCGASRPVHAAAPEPEREVDEADAYAPPPMAEPLAHARCTHCGAEAELASDVAATRCAFCASPLEVVAARSAAPPASNVVPFALSRDAAARAFREWLAGLWFRPSDLKRLAELREMRGVYLPAWIFSAHAHSRWTAEAGYHYYEDEVVERNGQRETRRVQRTRWESVSGRRSGDYRELVVCASRGLPEGELARVGTFRTDDALCGFDGDYLAGFEAERAARSARECWPHAEQIILRAEERECERDVPGDTHRNLRVETDIGDRGARDALLPLYVAAYEYRDKVRRVVVNGITGETAGDAPWSVVKITLFVLVLAALTALVVWYAQTH